MRLLGLRKPLPGRRFFVVGWILLASTSGIDFKANAELVYFAKGGEAQVPITIEGARIQIQIPGRTFDFSKEDFRKIIPDFWPEHEWKTRESDALKGGAAERSAAAWWAIENGLTPQAISMLKAAHQADPTHQPTARMVAALERLEEPVTDPDLEPLLRAIGGTCEVTRGPHVILIHQVSAAEANERVDLLERVNTTFHLLFAAHGVELRPIGRRLVSAFFAEHQDYLRFLQTEKLEVFRTTRGYFHPTMNAVLAYDSRSSRPLQPIRQANTERAGELTKLERAIDHLPAQARLVVETRGESPRYMSRAQARKHLQELRLDLSRRELSLELDRRAVDLGTAAHEMIHQLVANTGLAPRHDDFPIWLHEGLAAQFEVIRGGRWAGVARAHDLRLPDWRAITRRTSLARLVEDQGFGRGYQKDSYAQAWGLVYYLRKEHPQQFLTFLDLLRAPEVGQSRPKSRSLLVFRQAFGNDLEEIERGWHLYLDSLKTPLEEHRDPPVP